MKCLRPLAASVSFLALAPHAPLAAQDTREDEPRARAKRIVVTGGGLEQAPSEGAYAVTEIERERIVSTASGRIEDALRDVAGFQQFRRSDSRSANPTAQGATLRALGGNATSRALVLLDGVPIADPFFGYIPFNAIQPETLSAIRVTRGGGAGPFGAGALAGTIALESAGAAQLDPLLANIAVNDREESEASLVAVQDLGAGFAVASGRWDRGRGFFTTPDDQRVPASARAAFDNWQAGLRAVAPLADLIEVQARVNLFEDRRTLRFDGADSTNQGQDASLRVVGRGDWAFDALAYVQARDFSNIVISSTRFTRVLDQRSTPSTGLGGKFELRPPVGGDHTLRLGLDYRRADGELQEEAYNAFSGALNERRRAGGVNSNLGLFVEDDWSIGRLLLTGGLRADRTVIADGFYRAVDASGALVAETLAEDRSDWTLSWRAGAAYAASDGLRLRAAAYTGLRLPTLNELYRPFVVFPVVTQANAALENERLEGFEVGVDWQAGEALAVSLTAFDNRVENAIANVTIAENLRQRRNLPAIDAQGVEGNLRLALGTVSLDASLAYTDAVIDGQGPALPLDGNRPPQTPDFAASATLAWRPAAGWRLAATLRHTAAQFEDDQESDVLPAVTTLDAFAEIPVWREFSVVLRGENLTDEDIVTRNAGGSIDLGVPRTVWAGLRYGF
ncbi:TonB-dependent receptor [Erythrobacter sp. HL-111]|uniref:TonB-dependent receptor n=1 Tax=Erythrobacter sp. HL-111 TaxID=1798193 RepID=UPI0006D9A4F8|nr:TonB-dependent receptor [Erythrobacter sp. HL-111]KPP92892.1 MAG: TonB-dependent receptor [Erythrobacteraceae bacterium HL-111]SDT00531.1 Outer membrane receptor proteins, mostly Fe transport [Erythrobacter sp. HL-111]